MTSMSSRYFSYLDFLVRRGDGYDHVMLADRNDRVFQADPFATPLPADIVYTGERYTIDESPAVRDAMVSAYGEAVAGNLRDFTVVGPLHHTRHCVRHAALPVGDDAAIGWTNHTDHRCDR